MLSIIIPSYLDPYLGKTIQSLLDNAEGKIEVIPILDGYLEYKKHPQIKYDPRIKTIIFNEHLGMRAAINAGIKESKGKYIMKCDSHCCFAPGFDKTLIQNSSDNWLIIPRRYSIDENNWQRNFTRPYRDYHYFTFPISTGRYFTSLIIQDWHRSERTDPKFDIDDTLIFQGSCWMANKKYFKKRVGLLDGSTKTYTQFGGEQLEVGLKYWLGGGHIKVNKKTWYAHLSKRHFHYQRRMYTRHYKINNEAIQGRVWAAKHWMNNEEPGMVHPLSWLIEKFWPVPTWPEDRKLWTFSE